MGGQYPQADRGGCNKDGLHKVASADVRFSIHKRIVGGATWIRNVEVELKKMFQYPQADRGGCNALALAVNVSGASVSVSTSGSWGVQLKRQRLCWKPPRGFSIHKRIVGGATRP